MSTNSEQHAVEHDDVQIICPHLLDLRIRELPCAVGTSSGTITVGAIRTDIGACVFEAFEASGCSSGGSYSSSTCSMSCMLCKSWNNLDLMSLPVSCLVFWLTFAFEDLISDDLMLSAFMADAECFVRVAIAAVAVTREELVVRYAADLCVGVAQSCINLTNLSTDNFYLAMEYLI